MRRKQNFQTIAWFWDLYQRDLIDLDPPYQRRSVWNQSYKDYFVDTLLLGYPAPAIFLYEEIDPDGRALYHVVDGKQRLLTIFEFVSNEFPVADNATRTDLQDKYFRDLGTEDKREFWAYPFSVEYLSTEDDTVIDNVFDRINRNMAKLTAQELRHAKYSGEFITCAEELSEWMRSELGDGSPNIAPRSRRQMKDVELVAHLLLLLEKGPKGYSSAELDAEFSSRDAGWEAEAEVRRDFRDVVGVLAQMLRAPGGDELARSRLRNQADFYSLFGAIEQVTEAGAEVDVGAWVTRLVEFASSVDDEERRGTARGLGSYYEAVRSASNDSGPRQTRIQILAKALQGLSLDE